MPTTAMKYIPTIIRLSIIFALSLCAFISLCASPASSLYFCLTKIAAMLLLGIAALFYRRWLNTDPRFKDFDRWCMRGFPE